MHSFWPIAVYYPFCPNYSKKMLLGRLRPILMNKNLIPNHQFGFRGQHSIIELLVSSFSGYFASFRQSMAHWTTALQIKSEPATTLLQKSYLENRQFFVKIQDEQTKLCTIGVGVPQGNVLGPLFHCRSTYYDTQRLQHLHCNNGVT